MFMSDNRHRFESLAFNRKSNALSLWTDGGEEDGIYPTAYSP